MKRKKREKREKKDLDHPPEYSLVVSNYLRILLVMVYQGMRMILRCTPIRGRGLGKVVFVKDWVGVTHCLMSFSLFMGYWSSIDNFIRHPVNGRLSDERMKEGQRKREGGRDIPFQPGYT